MGFYLRKSISVGPLRFNLSKSGVGVSAGIKGLRLGAGPRGNYVHLGRGGLYYRKTLPSAPSVSSERSPAPCNGAGPLSPEMTDGTHAPLEDIESGSVFSMCDSDSAELLNELNNKQKKLTIWPFSLVFGIVLTAWMAWPVIGFILTAIITGTFYYYDLMRKTTVLFYELESDVKPLYEALHRAIDKMSSSNKIWHIEAQGAVYDRKYHAGADRLEKRNTTFINKKPLPFIKTNIAVPAIGVGQQTLLFFPDRLLIFKKNAVGAVSYRDLDINSDVRNFIEEEHVPSDSVIVGMTWRYVNKDGGPDRRFGSNPEIPIVEYSYIDLTSNTGLNERICLSNADVGARFEEAVKRLR